MPSMANKLSGAARPAVAVLSPSVQHQQKRFAHDLVKKSLTGRPIMAQGPGGRHSSTGHVATVFGCTGFLGRYLVNKLARRGTQVIVPYREEDDKRHLRVMGDLGQIVPLEWNLNNDLQIEECVRHSDVVYNIVGRDFETKNFSYNDVNVEGARRIARIASLAGVSRLVHASHLNADHNSKSAFYRSKAEGEEAVKEAFEGATIVRPGPMYGHEDRLLNKMVVRPWQFRVNGLQTQIKPVNVVDVAKAMEVIMDAESTLGSTVSLPGPQTYTYEELFAVIEGLTFRSLAKGMHTPKWAFSLGARIWENIWWPTISPDEVKRKYISDRESEVGTLGFGDLGIVPDRLEDVAIQFLRHYRPAVFHDLPITSGGVKLKQGRYHVVD